MICRGVASKQHRAFSRVSFPGNFIIGVFLAETLAVMPCGRRTTLLSAKAGLELEMWEENSTHFPSIIHRQRDQFFGLADANQRLVL